MGENIFSSSPYTIIYCEFDEVPFNWDVDWNPYNITVYWNGEWEYNSEGIPTPINQ